MGREDSDATSRSAMREASRSKRGTTWPVHSVTGNYQHISCTGKGHCTILQDELLSDHVCNNTSNFRLGRSIQLHQDCASYECGRHCSG